MKFARVALAVPLMRLFDYALPDGLLPEVGARVIVPFGTQKRIGIVVALPEQSDLPVEQLKTVIEILDQQPIFSASMWNLLHWAASYYQAPLGDALFSALPVKLRNGESAVQKPKIFWKLTALGQEALASGVLTKAKKQFAAASALAKSPLEKGNNEFNAAIWSALKEKQYIDTFEQPVQPISWQQRLQDEPIVKAENRLLLNKQQSLALGRLLFQQGFGAFLLDGVTGSGKTEIYLQLIEETLKKGKQVLVLVPEIGLTPQTVQRFRSRFNVEIDVLHSNLNDTQRLDVWQRARTGQSAVIIGTRSAIFTPFSELGLIVIDEEHDASFKQQEGWRYHARDLAVVYAKQLNIPIVMGSATPSLETLNNVRNGKYQHIVLSQRAGNASMVQSQLIDLKKQQVVNGLSSTLLKKMDEQLQNGNQVLLFLNRRGFAPALLCHECGWIATCAHCDKPLTYHQHQRAMRCHHCSSQKPIPRQCGDCGSTHLVTTGLGTEQLEQTLKERFPQYRITRIDRDSTARKGKLESHLEDIRQGKSQILIGTQMLAKGHHFPNVTLVALINVDSSLFSVDFRAEERLAQLYVQVAGRAGRAEKQGEVVLQTHYPEHPLLQRLLTAGYHAFADDALKMRHTMGLPPFSAQALFKAQSRKSQEAEQLLNDIAAYFYQWKQAKNQPHLQILGAMPAPFAKKADYFRWQLLLQHPSRAWLQAALTDFHQQWEHKSSQVRLNLDVDPQDLS
ncbi:replication restart DNA helicase PriA [Pasteurella langaaensis DSM 22999]|uniref:Replication restart protein PriA n=1 Tax=Alitibacter langaaensis DSM 22999 TaxID=1122935 RepID=A0A2U0SKK3_9PAST|nr:primosomal protein N' [Pasteurella langaaensis]PVX31863.1 replication restart DNA helicase PriA [Pasteurella langaaensis DSM 22999]